LNLNTINILALAGKANEKNTEKKPNKCKFNEDKLVSFKYLVASTLFLQYLDVFEYSLSLSLSHTHTHTHKCLDMEIADIIVEPM
jgi:hypothetical protein